MKKKILSILTCITLGGFANAQSIIYVDANASGLNNGTTWANAYNDLQYALSTAVNWGDQIWIKSGVYVPDASVPISRGASFSFYSSGVSIYGGFNGTETHPDQRDIENNPTILSGDNGQNDHLDVFTDNAFHVIVAGRNNLHFDGIIIEGGYADGSVTNAYGSAIHKYISTKEISMNQCVVRNNYCEFLGAVYYRQDMTTSDSLTFTVTNCEFYGNKARAGSAIYVETRNDIAKNSNVQGLSVNVSNSLFYENESMDTPHGTGRAGSSISAVARGSALTLNLTNCTFTKNQDTWSDPNNVNRNSTIVVGIHPSAHSSTTMNTNIANCIFWNNKDKDGNLATNSITLSDNNSPTSLEVDNSLMTYPSEIPVAGLSNCISSDPLFANAGLNDFRLSSGSPAIDAGNNSYVVGTEDLAGNSRIYNSTIDMGAYEFNGSNPSVGVEENAMSNINVFPNPASNTIQISGWDVESVKIFDVNGSLVKNSKSSIVSIEELEQGVYYLEVTSTTQQSTTKKIIKN